MLLRVLQGLASLLCGSQGPDPLPAAFKLQSNQLEEQRLFSLVFPPSGSSRPGGRSSGFAPRRGRWRLQLLPARCPGRQTMSSCPVRAYSMSTSKWVGAPGGLQPQHSSVSLET